LCSWLFCVLFCVHVLYWLVPVVVVALGSLVFGLVLGLCCVCLVVADLVCRWFCFICVAGLPFLCSCFYIFVFLDQRLGALDLTFVVRSQQLERVGCSVSKIRKGMVRLTRKGLWLLTYWTHTTI